MLFCHSTVFFSAGIICPHLTTQSTCQHIPLLDAPLCPQPHDGQPVELRVGIHSGTLVSAACDACCVGVVRMCNACWSRCCALVGWPCVCCCALHGSPSMEAAARLAFTYNLYCRALAGTCTYPERHVPLTAVYASVAHECALPCLCRCLV